MYCGIKYSKWSVKHPHADWNYHDNYKINIILALKCKWPW